MVPFRVDGHILLLFESNLFCGIPNDREKRNKRTLLQILSIIESVDSISKDERGFPLTQYITNGRISRGRYTFTHFKHYHRVLRLISYSMSV